MIEKFGGPGVDRLCGDSAGLLRGKRVGLVAHAASVDGSGCPSAERLAGVDGVELAALFSPEHGFSGVAGAGEKVGHGRHPRWDIPVYSLYGATRRPTAAMLRGLDVLVFDLQDLSIRCYTYVSTLRYVLEAAAGCGLPVVVADRSNPLAGVVDGPMLEARWTSFVGCFPGPFIYGLTSGGAAEHLVRALRLKVGLTVVRGGEAGAAGPRWVSPSPGIRCPHTAWCYPITVGFEALPAVEYGRASLTPFARFGTEGLDEDALVDRLMGQRLPGVAFYPEVWEREGRVWRGARIAVLDPSGYRPAATAVAVLAALQALLGAGPLWRTRGARPAFFDRLFGTDAVRRGVQAGVSWRRIAGGWERGLARWRAEHGLS